MDKRNLIYLYVFIVIGIFVVLLFGGSNSFTVKLFSDTTSSGGTRLYNASLSFENNNLVSGTQRYEVWPGVGNHSITYCVFENGSVWINNETKEVCTLNRDLPLTKKELYEKINSGEYKPYSECGHFDTCYELIK